jgi:hypothetical protein
MNIIVRCPRTGRACFQVTSRERHRYNQLQKILFPQPYAISFEDLTEDQAKTVWDSYLAHVPLGVRADFSTS